MRATVLWPSFATSQMHVTDWALGLNIQFILDWHNGRFSGMVQDLAAWSMAIRRYHWSNLRSKSGSSYVEHIDVFLFQQISKFRLTSVTSGTPSNWPEQSLGASASILVLTEQKVDSLESTVLSMINGVRNLKYRLSVRTLSVLYLSFILPALIRPMLFGTLYPIPNRTARKTQTRHIGHDSRGTL